MRASVVCIARYGTLCTMRTLAFASLLALAMVHCGPSVSPIPDDGATDSAAQDTSAPDSAITDSAAPDVVIEDSAITDSAIADSGPAPAPISAPSETWTYVPIEGMRCGNGSATGIGVNLTTRSSKVLFILQGGGACWDVNTCFVLRSAANLDGYSEAAFANERNALASAAILNRSDPNNPFRDASFVYVPYCTGDVHSGRNVFRYEANGMTRDIHHVGAQNMDALLARVRATIPAPEHVWLYGMSAGGYGVVTNWWRFKRAFAGAPVDAASDCGVPVTPPDGRYATWTRVWNSEFPPSCTDCASNLTNVLTTQLAMFRSDRFAQLAYTQDGVLSTFYGTTGATFQTLVTGLQTRLQSESNARTFVLAGNSHVMVGSYATLRAADGTALNQWIPQWATGAAAWASHGP